MGGSMVGEHAPIRDPCLVDAVQINAVLADYLENMMSSMMMMSMSMMKMMMMMMMMMPMRSNVALF